MWSFSKTRIFVNGEEYKGISLIEICLQRSTNHSTEKQCVDVYSSWDRCQHLYFKIDKCLTKKKGLERKET